MPRPKPKDFDFKVHVDPSCLSAPMDEDTASQQQNAPNVEEMTNSSSPDVAVPVVAVADAADSAIDEDMGDEEEDITDMQPEDESEDQIGHKEDEQEPQDDLQGPQEDVEGADDETPMPTQLLTAEEASEYDLESHRSSSPDRRTSGRTEALIQAAARAVVARIEKQKTAAHIEGGSELSSSTDDIYREYGLEGTELSYSTQSEDDRRGSWASQSQASHRESDARSLPSVHALAEDGGDSSSHHEAESDVFSDRSPRSSLGSFDGTVDHNKDADDMTTQHTRSPRISDISQYEQEDFVPTARGTPRLPFRTPSNVRAIQMSSPPPSVFSSPRSSKRPTLPTISRLGSPRGSPSASAQYSPKGRATPPRFKSRKVTAPLVLLHVTLLPLRWPWASVLEAAPTEVLSPEAKTLRESWRHLHDRMGDTVFERGILLPHPQNDYEVLEERLLEALELPLRRRARILECGHYVGPANEMTLTEDMDSEDEDFDARSMQSGMTRRTHWCATCRHEIKYESLGTGKIFRVKIYASNGLMRAGAWDACWKEMERVDAELEPLVDPTLLGELEHLAMEQREAAEHDADALHLEDSIHEPEYVEREPPILSSSPIPEIHVSHSRPITAHDEERRLREEARLREIYGQTPPPVQHEPTSSMHPHPDSYIPPPTPPSPSAEAYERRQYKRQSYQTASLPELLLEAAKVFMSDRKNVAIVVMSVLVLMLALRSAPREDFHTMRRYDEYVTTVAKEVPTVEVRTPVMEAIEAVTSSATTASSQSSLAPCEPLSATAQAVEQDKSGDSAARAAPRSPEEPQLPAAAQSQIVATQEVVRVVETVTETVKVTATETEIVKTDATEVVKLAPASFEAGGFDDVSVDQEQVVGEDASNGEEL